MRYCDLTFAYTPSSGGIRTFIEHKRAQLCSDDSVEHVLIVPGETDRDVTNGRCRTIELASPLLPGCAPYRMFTRPQRILSALRASAPDVIELGTYFLEPWPAFRYRNETRRAGRRCLVGGYFHTDLSRAYFAAPVEGLLRPAVGPTVARNLAQPIARLTARYFGSIFRRCDVMCAASTVQAARLAAYHAPRAQVVPLGVDTEVFTPERRDPSRRAALQAGEHDVVFVFAGRLDAEKQVEWLVDAFLALELPGKQLWLLGEGPARLDLLRRAAAAGNIHLLGYQRKPADLAAWLASADVYVTAGAHETFGLATVEAQACGLPTVGVDAGALRERVVTGTGSLTPVGDMPAFTAAMGMAAARRREFGSNARAHVLAAGLDWRSSIERWKRVYDVAYDSAPEYHHGVRAVPPRPCRAASG